MISDKLEESDGGKSINSEIESGEVRSFNSIEEMIEDLNRPDPFDKHEPR